MHGETIKLIVLSRSSSVAQVKSYSLA